MFGAAFIDLAAFLTAVGSVLTAAWTWVTGALGAVELAIAESFLLQTAVGIAIAMISLLLLSKIAKLVVSFIRK